MLRGIGKMIKGLFGLCFTLMLIAMIVYVDARYIEPKLLWVKEETIPTTKLSNGTKLKAVLFSDVHLGENYSLTDFEKIVTKINSLQPDIILFAGDIVDDYKTFTQDQETITVLQKLKSKYGKYAVYGNHDHGGYGTKRYAKIMKASGMTLLKDEDEMITLENGEQIRIIGVDDIVLGKPNFDEAFKHVSETQFNLFISHAPDVVDKVAQQPIDLQVSGHSHGGQVRLPFIGAPLTVPYGTKYIKGLYRAEEKPNMPLYVSSGIGTSQLPYRFMNVPEIVILWIEGQ